MPLDFDATDEVIAARLAGDGSLTDDMAAVIARCEAITPHPDWQRLRGVAYEADLPPLTVWVTRTFGRKPPTVRLAGLWFGLCNPVLRDGSAVADMYLSGCSSYRRDDPSFAWVRPDYFPRKRFARCQSLRTIFRIAYERETGGLGNDAEYPLCLAFAAFAIKRLLKRIDPGVVLCGATLLGVAVGFDSGTPKLLGELRPDGLITTWRE